MKQDKQYKIKGDKSGRLFTAEPNLTETMKLKVVIFNLLSVEKNDIDGNNKYYANNVRYDQIEEVK